MTENNGEISQDGAVVVTLPVPAMMTKTLSAPELCSMSNGVEASANNSFSNVVLDLEKGGMRSEESQKYHTNKKELLKKYSLHIFVCVTFVITVLSVSLSWHFRNMAEDYLYYSQTIFFQPRTRELTLTDPAGKDSLRGRLGLNIPMWMLPLHCPMISTGNPHYRECLWKDNAILRIVHFRGPGVQCYNVSWESLSSKYAPHDCFYINDGRWYGPSNQSNSYFPISGEFRFLSRNYTLNNNGLFNSVVDFYWLSSKGAAIYINANNPVQFTWNASGDNQLCVLSNFSGPLYHKTNSYDYPDTNYTLCSGADSLKTHLFMQSMFAPKGDLHYPDDGMLLGSHWSLKNFAGTANITQGHLMDLLLNVTEYSFQDNHLTLDGHWQEAHGDLVFDKRRFPNMTDLLTTLHSNGSRLTLLISPYFQYTSQNFRTGIAKSMFVKDAGGEVTGLANFECGLAAILDVFADGAIDWYNEKLQKIMDFYEIMSFRLSYGHQAWLPYKPHFRDVDASLNMYRKLVTESLAALPKSSFIVEHTSDSRHVTSLIPVASEIKEVDGRMCITGIIETALTLGLLGYPFLMADGIKLEEQLSQPPLQAPELPPRELYIRWLQLATLFPAFQFTVMPWEYDLDVVHTAVNLTAQHNLKIVPEIKDKALQEEVANGFPIIRPVWWLDPHNSTVHDMEIKDEFLIGNNLLIAPVLCEHVLERDVYIPPGVWEDMQKGNFILGPNLLKDYSIPSHGVVMFRRRKVIGGEVTE